MICNARHASNDKATTANNWRTPGTSVLRRYNTPPLREDLVPRSRMAPEGKQKRKRRGKTNLLHSQSSETKEPCEVEQKERRNATKMNKVKNTPLEKRNKEHYGSLEIARLRMTSAEDKKELKPLWLK